MSPAKYFEQSIDMLLNSYGINKNLHDSSMFYFYKWKNEGLPLIFKKIKFTNSIGIYWIGYPDEKEKAKKYLMEYSGQDFDEPEKYLQWYRKNILGFDEDIK